MGVDLRGRPAAGIRKGVCGRRAAWAGGGGGCLFLHPDAHLVAVDIKPRAAESSPLWPGQRLGQAVAREPCPPAAGCGQGEQRRRRQGSPHIGWPPWRVSRARATTAARAGGSARVHAVAPTPRAASSPAHRCTSHQCTRSQQQQQQQQRGQPSIHERRPPRAVHTRVQRGAEGLQQGGAVRRVWGVRGGCAERDRRVIGQPLDRVPRPHPACRCRCRGTGCA